MKLFLTIAILIAIFSYLLTAFLGIMKTYFYSKRGKSNLTKLSLLICLYLVFGFLSNIFFNYNPRLTISRLIFTCFLLFEIFYLFQLQEIAIQNKKLKNIFRLLILITIPYIIKLSFVDYHYSIYYSLFLFESLVAATLSVTYFIQLGSEITKKNVFAEPVTILMMGLFFCFGMPLSFSSSILTVEFINKDIFSHHNEINNNQSLVIFMSISLIETLCYVVFNLFILKAFTCKQNITT